MYDSPVSGADPITDFIPHPGIELPIELPEPDPDQPWWDSFFFGQVDENGNQIIIGAAPDFGPNSGLRALLKLKCVPVQAAKLLGPGTTIGAKISKQLAKRGWTEELVRSTVNNPVKTFPWKDTRRLPGGGRMNDPATVFYSGRGGYVVRNDLTGDIVQISDRLDPNWISPWKLH